MGPAEEQKDEIGKEKSEDATDEVCTMRYKHCRTSTKADENLHCYNDGCDWPQRSCQALVSLLVCGEPPEEAAKDVSDPEEGVDQHRLVVLRAHPIVLRQT